MGLDRGGARGRETAQGSAPCQTLMCGHGTLLLLLSRFCRSMIRARRRLDGLTTAQFLA